MKTPLSKVFCLLLFIGLSWSPASAQDTTRRPPIVSMADLPASDSVFAEYTIEDLLEFQKYYTEQTERLIEEKNDQRLKAIQDLEAFLKGHPDSPILDKILIRLAELHYQQASYDYEQALDQESQSDSLYAAELPELDYNRTLELYQQIIDEFPNSPLLDDALYHRAFLFENLGQREKAYDQYQALVESHPESDFVPDAFMRMAEYFFNPPERNIDKAIELYEKLLTFKESPRYDAALYRLGWCYYILNDYPRAIAYFTLLADDIKRTRELDPEVKHHFPAVRDEAVEYIGISFLDFGGPQKAADYFGQIGGREYGLDVLKKIGDALMDVKEEYANAVEAYQLMLSMYPNSPQAPLIQARIAEAYHYMEDEDKAYSRRAELFAKYRSGSEWWQKVTDVEAKKRASELAEHALRDNINLLLQKAEKNDDASLYRQAVSDARQYLETFPEDSNAVRIHWNMALTLDTKLNQRDQAFEEYIEISNRYWGSEFQKLAAENAIALQDEALRQESGRDTALVQEAVATAQADSIPEAQIEPEPLSDTEEKLAYALHNYTKLFPHEPETAKILAKTGALHYEHHQFNDALKYFKTLIKHFPESEEADEARYLTMESYFGKGDYQSTELIAHQVRDLAPEYSEKANTRLAEAIFQHAKTLADSAQHLRAANEFLRMVKETPTSEFADMALYNAALQFEEVEEYQNAIASYTQLINNYPKSQYYIDAMNNLAFDYREIEDYSAAAEVYSRLADVSEDPEKAQVALYNASVSYVQAQEWLRAIETNNTFVERYPDAEDADDLLFNNAGYYLKMNDIASANDIYARFSEKYPNSPRVVEALYHRGDYFMRNNRLADARAQFQNAIDKSEELKKNGQDPNDFYACEALFQLTEIKYEQFTDLKLKLPEPVLKANKTRKKELLLELVESYTRVASYGTVRLYQATFRIGQAYEEFAATWFEQEIPPMEDNQKIVARKEISSTAADLFEKAVDSYKDGIKVLERVAKADADSIMADTSETRLAKISTDSTLASAENWIARCKEKVSENLYRIAETQYAALANLRNAPTPAGLSKLEELVYQQQVLLKAIHPITQEILAAHIRNIRESRELDLQNQWVEQSKTEITRIGSIVPDELLQLSQQAMMAYNAQVNRFDNLIEVNDETAFDFSEQLGSFAELGSGLLLTAAQGYREKIEHLRSLDIRSAEIDTTEKVLMQNLLVFTETADSLAQQVENRRKYYNAKFQETDNINYEDAYFIFDDLVFAWNENGDKALEAGYEISRELNIANIWSQKLVQKLVKSDPERYAAELGLDIKTNVIASSADWQVSLEYENGWTQIDFADSSWNQAISEGTETQLAASDAQAIWFTTIAKAENTNAEEVVEADSETQTSGNGNVTFVRPERVYFRKAFDVEGIPVDGTVQLQADDSYRLYVNGSLVAEYEAGAETSNQEAHKHSVKEELGTGANVLALEVYDTDGSEGNLQATLELQYLPDWFDEPETDTKLTEKPAQQQMVNQNNDKEEN